jgi:hypothetical protein
MTAARYSQPPQCRISASQTRLEVGALRVRSGSVRSAGRLAAVGGTHPARRCCDRQNAMAAHHPLDPAAADATALPPQHRMGRGDCQAPAALVMACRIVASSVALDCVRSLTAMAAPGMIACRPDLEHGAHQPRRKGVAVVLLSCEKRASIGREIE